MAKLSVKHAGTWKEPTNVGVKVAGTWKTPTGVFVKSGGTWTKVWPTSDPTLPIDFDFTKGLPFPSAITYTRAAGIATVTTGEGLVKAAPQNFFPYSENITAGFPWVVASSAVLTADQTLAPNGTMTGDRIAGPNTGTSPGGVRMNVVSTIHGVVSIYAKKGTNNWLSINSAASANANACWFDLANGVVGTMGADWLSRGMVDAGNGWWRCWAVSGGIINGPTFRSCTNDLHYNVLGTVSGTIFVWGVQGELGPGIVPGPYLPTTTVARYDPRIEYDPITKACRGLMIEGDAINRLPSYNDFSSGNWTKSNVTVTVNSTTDPAGASAADTLVASGTPGHASAYFNVPDATAFCVSVFLKAGTSNWAYIAPAFMSSTWPLLYVDLATGTLGSVDTAGGITGYGIIPYPNGWYRVWATRTSGTTTTEGLRVGPCNANGSTAVTVGKTIYAWGGQLEVVPHGLFPTSLVATGSTSMSRGAESAIVGGFGSIYNAAAGTFVTEFLTWNFDTRVIFDANDGTAANDIDIYCLGAAVSGYVSVASVVQANPALGNMAARTVAALAYAPNDFAGCLNGGTVVTDTAGTLPATLTQLELGTDRIGPIETINGCIASLKYYNVRKTNAELQALTNPPVVVTVTTAGAGSTVVPAGMTKAKIECWGAGGGGYGGGGSGGAYSRVNTLAVTAGATLYYLNAAGTAGGGAQPVDTWARIGTNAAPTTTAQGCLADSGQNAHIDNFTGELGGLASACVGDVKFDGGGGGNTDAANQGGGGGGAAGDANRGLSPWESGSYFIPGIGGNVGGGNGGRGSDSSGTYIPPGDGQAPGGGGGGSWTAADANGANGKIVITFTP
jgi:hypothetical protein